jgi:hypothetical protein
VIHVTRKKDTAMVGILATNVQTEELIVVMNER